MCHRNLIQIILCSLLWISVTRRVRRKKSQMHLDAQPSNKELEDIRETVLKLASTQKRLNHVVEEADKISTQKVNVGVEFEEATEKWESLAKQLEILDFKGENVKKNELTPDVFAAASRKKDLQNKFVQLGRDLQQITAVRERAEAVFKETRTKFEHLSEAFPDQSAKLLEDPRAFDAQLGGSNTQAVANEGDKGLDDIKAPPLAKRYLQTDGNSAIIQGSIIVSHADIMAVTECMRLCDDEDECHSFMYGMVEDSLWCVLARYSWIDGSDEGQHDMYAMGKFKVYYVIPDDYWTMLKDSHEGVSNASEHANRLYMKPQKKHLDKCAFGSASWLSVVDSVDVKGCEKACDAIEACNSILFPKYLKLQGAKGLCITTSARENDYTGSFQEDDEELQASKCAIMEDWDGSKSEEQNGEMGVYFVPEHHLQLKSSIDSSEEMAPDRREEPIGLYNKLESQGKANGCPSFAWWNSIVKVTSEFSLKNCEEACDVTLNCKSFMWTRKTCIMLGKIFQGKEKLFDVDGNADADLCKTVEVYYASNHPSSAEIWNLAHTMPDREVVDHHTFTIARSIEQHRHPYATLKACAEKTHEIEIDRKEVATYQECAKSCKMGECADFLHFSDDTCITYSRKLGQEELHCIFGKDMLDGKGLWNERPFYKLDGCWQKGKMKGGKSWWDYILQTLEEEDAKSCEKACTNTYECEAVMYYSAKKTCILLHIPWQEIDPKKFELDKEELCADTQTHYVMPGTSEAPENGQCCKYVDRSSCDLPKTYSNGKVRQYCPIHSTVWWQYPSIVNSKHGATISGKDIFRGDREFVCPLLLSLYSVEVETFPNPLDCSPNQIGPDHKESCVFVSSDTDCSGSAMLGNKRRCESLKDKFNLATGRYTNTGICMYPLS